MTDKQLLNSLTDEQVAIINRACTRAFDILMDAFDEVLPQSEAREEASAALARYICRELL